jgi:hypothetical protein
MPPGSGAGIWDGTVTAFGPPAVSQPWPTFGQTVAGDRWWRSDTPSTANQRLYMNRTWPPGSGRWAPTTLTLWPRLPTSFSPPGPLCRED